MAKPFSVRDALAEVHQRIAALVPPVEFYEIRCQRVSEDGFWEAAAFLGGTNYPVCRTSDGNPVIVRYRLTSIADRLVTARPVGLDHLPGLMHMAGAGGEDRGKIRPRSDVGED